MDDTQVVEIAPVRVSFWDDHRYLLLLTITIGISLFLVGISMSLYTSSGAAQLDLSRPGYRAVSSQAAQSDNDFENYPTSGEIDKSAIEEFRTLYQQQAAKAKAVDAFGGDPLNPDILEISAPQAAQ